MATSLYGRQVLEDGAQGYYRLNETSGTVAHDLSRNQADATLSSVSAYSQPGAIFNDGDTSLTFTGAGTLTLPNSFNTTGWSVFSLEFWLNGSHQVFTVNTATPLFYLNGAAAPPPATYVVRPFSATLVTVSTLTLQVNTIATWLANYVTGSNLDEVALYKYILLPIQIFNHYYIGTQG